jgi:hypothetical protein
MDAEYQFIVGNLSESASANFLDRLGERAPDDLLAALVVADKRDYNHRSQETVGKHVRVERPSDLINDDDLERGPDVSALGKRIFWRWSSALHDFACVGKGENKDLRAKVVRAVTGNGAGSVAFLAAFLSVHFNLSAAESALISALTVRLLGKPALEEVCETWSRSLKEHEDAV